MELSNLHLFGFYKNDFQFVRLVREVPALVNTCIMFYNTSCFVGSSKVSSIFQFGVVMKFVTYWITM